MWTWSNELYTASRLVKLSPKWFWWMIAESHMSMTHFCLEVKREDNQNGSVLCCVRQLCTMISTLRWAVLTVHWIGFYHTGSISLCIDLFVFVCMYLMTGYVSTVGWAWWDWSRRPSLLWHCWLGHLNCKNPSPIWRIMCFVGHLPCSTTYIFVSCIIFIFF